VCRQFIALQGNGKVRMSTVPAAHQGLGVAYYTWASSPLRRYVDLINQRQIIAWLREESPPYPAQERAHADRRCVILSKPTRLTPSSSAEWSVLVPCVG
jgi:exoribonuclease R